MLVWALQGRGWLGRGHASLHQDPLLPAPCMRLGAAPSPPPEGRAVLRFPGFTRCGVGVGSKRGLSLLPAGRRGAERAGVLPPIHSAWPRLRARRSPVSWNARLGPPAEQLSREDLCAHQQRSARLQVCVMRAPAPHAQPRGRRGIPRGGSRLSGSSRGSRAGGARDIPGDAGRDEGPHVGCIRAGDAPHRARSRPAAEQGRSAQGTAARRGLALASEGAEGFSVGTRCENRIPPPQLTPGRGFDSAQPRTPSCSPVSTAAAGAGLTRPCAGRAGSQAATHTPERGARSRGCPPCWHAAWAGGGDKWELGVNRPGCQQRAAGPFQQRLKAQAPGSLLLRSLSSRGSLPLGPPAHPSRRTRTVAGRRPEAPGTALRRPRVGDVRVRGAPRGPPRCRGTALRGQRQCSYPTRRDAAPLRDAERVPSVALPGQRVLIRRRGGAGRAQEGTAKRREREESRDAERGGVTLPGPGGQVRPHSGRCG